MRHGQGAADAGRPVHGTGLAGRVATAAVGSRTARLAAAAASGGLLALTLPPLDLWPAVFAWSALVLISLAADAGRRPALERALVGAAFGFGYHLAGLWWIGVAFLVDAATFGPFLPLGVVGLPLLLAPFHAVALVLVGLAPRTAGWRVVALCVAVSLTEFLRGVLFTGFPWNVPAVQLSGSLTLVQGAAVVGVAGLALPAVMIGAAPAALFARRDRWAAALGAAALAGLVGYGTLRLAAPPPQDHSVRVRIVQPAVPQELKWDPQSARDIWGRLLALTAMAGADGTVPPVVVWPETALPFLYSGAGVARQDIAAALDGRTLVTGAVVVADDGATNSVFVIAPDGRIVQRYDKLHLVPFGEYLPFAPLLSRLGLSRLVEGTSDFRAGAVRAALGVPGLPPLLPLICYEAIFRFDVGAARLVLNVTNDAWFGATPGPGQHLRHVQLRAIESGLPVVRAANTGVSAIVDATGRLRAKLELNQRGVLDGPVPGAIDTPHRRWGEGPLVVSWLIILAAAVAARRAARRESSTRG